MVKIPLVNAEDASLILGWEDTLEKEMETHSSILVWEIPWIEEPGGLQSMTQGSNPHFLHLLHCRRILYH